MANDPAIDSQADSESIGELAGPPRSTTLRCPVCGSIFASDAAGCPQHADTLVPADPLVGAVLKKTWRLDEPLGHGGTALVYSAQHITLPGSFAVKVLAKDRARDPAHRERFVREAEAQALIQHDNVVRVIEIGHDEKHDVVFVAMEHVKGETLKDVVDREGPLGVERAVSIVSQILDAIGAAHDVGMLHRDLKPQNVMLTTLAGKGDRVRVLDFGGKPIERSKALPVDARARTALTLPGTLFGTPAYMSPEQARGEALDERSDIYAAAVVLLHVLIGRSPFRGRDLTDTLSRVLTMMPPRPSLVRPEDAKNIPPGLEIVLLKALSKDPIIRFKSAGEFKRALVRFSRPPDPKTKEPVRLTTGEIVGEGQTIVDDGEGPLALRRMVDEILMQAA